MHQNHSWPKSGRANVMLSQDRGSIWHEPRCYMIRTLLRSIVGKDKAFQMKLFDTKVLPLMLVFTVVMTSLVEQGRVKSCPSTFFSALVQLIPYRAVVAPFSTLPPSKACCNALKAIGQPCLCVLVNGPPISGVDQNMFLQLPEMCTANFEPCNYMSHFLNYLFHVS